MKSSIQAPKVIVHIKGATQPLSKTPSRFEIGSFWCANGISHQHYEVVGKDAVGLVLENTVTKDIEWCTRQDELVRSLKSWCLVSDVKPS